MSDPMWSGGPEQFQDRYPASWATFPQWMRDPLMPSTPPQSAFAMSVTCLLLMSVPVVGTGAAVYLGEYQRYYGDAYESNPPGSHTDTPYQPQSPEPYIPAYGVDPTTEALLEDIQTRVLDCQNRLVDLDSAVNLILDRMPTGSGDPPIASTVDTSRILAALYYIAQMPMSWRVDTDNTEVLAAVDAVGTSVDGLATNCQEGFAASLSRDDAQTELIGNETQTVLAALGDIDIPEQSGGRYPGASLCDFGSPHVITVPTVITEAMDGLRYTIDAWPSGQSRQVASTHTRYKGLAWCAFLTADGEPEPRQLLELGEGIVAAQAMVHAAGVVVYCKPGAQLTVTGWLVSTETA